jgi:hypothetical protein
MKLKNKEFQESGNSGIKYFRYHENQEARNSGIRKFRIQEFQQ